MDKTHMSGFSALGCVVYLVVFLKGDVLSGIILFLPLYLYIYIYILFFVRWKAVESLVGSFWLWPLSCMVLNSEGTKVFFKWLRKVMLVDMSLLLIRNLAIAYVCYLLDRSRLRLCWGGSVGFENKKEILCRKETLNVWFNGKCKLQEVWDWCYMNVTHFGGLFAPRMIAVEITICILSSSQADNENLYYLKCHFKICIGSCVIQWLLSWNYIQGNVMTEQTESSISAV